MNFKRGRILVYIGMIFALAVMALPTASLAAPASQGNTRHFPETNQDVSGRFLQVWQGGRSDADAIYINGYPISDVHDEISLTDGKIYKMQWFERARFEQHPENQQPYDVLLGLLGVFAAEGRKDQPFQGIANPNNGTQWFPETKHTVGDTSDGGKAIAQFWTQKGGIQQFGFPLSQPFQEVTKETDPKYAGKSFLVQYFERQRFEYHPENAGTPFVVLLGRLGAEQQNQVPVMETAMGGDRSNPVGTLNVGRGQDPGTLMPYNDNTLIGTNLLSAVFNSMVYRDPDNKLIPDLAYYVPTLDNGGAYYVGTGGDKHLVIKYKLKRGIKWADGQEETSNDWIYTYKLVLNPDFPAASRQGFEKWSSVDNPDKYTVIVNFLSANEAAALIKRDAATYGFMQYYVDNNLPVVDPVYNELWGAVLPEHTLTSMNAADIVGSDYSRTPFGTGPYKVTKFDTGQAIDMTVNTNYNVTPTKPAIQNIHSPLYTDNKQLPVGIDTGTIDLTTSESITPDQLPDLQAVVNKGHGKLLNQAGYGYEHLDFNTQKAPFNDVRVRQAVRYALDMDSINKAVFGGGLTILTSWLPPGNFASAQNPDNVKNFPDLISQIPQYKYDVNMANTLLDQAGWVKGSDGVRTKGGQRLTLDWLTTTKSYRKLVSQAAQQYMNAVGFDDTPDVKPAGQVFAPPPDGPLYSGSYGDFGLVEFAWAFTTDQPGGDSLFELVADPGRGEPELGR